MDLPKPLQSNAQSPGTQNQEDWHIRLKAVVEHMTEGLMLSDASGNLLSMNRAALAIHEFADESEMLRKLDQYPELFEVHDLEGNVLPVSQWPLAHAIAGRRFSGYEVHVRRKDTGRSWIGSYGGTPVRDAAGNVELIVLTLSDVTDKRRAEAELRESEERLRLGLEAGNTGTWDWDIVNNIVRWSERVYAFHGLKRDEFGGKVEDFTRLIHPEDAERVSNEIQAAIREHRPYIVEFRVVHRSGETRWISTNGKVYYAPDGTPLRMLGATSDVTERKRGEESLKRATFVTDTLYRLGLAMTGELDVHKLVQSITDAGTKLAGAQFGAFFYNIINDNGESYMLYTLSGVPREKFSKFPMPRATDLFGPTFRGEGVIRLDDVTKDSRYGHMAPHHGMPSGHLPVCSYLAVPVKSRSGEVIGGLFFGHALPGVFSEETETLISGIAAQAGLVLDNAYLLRQSRESEAKFRQLANTIPQLAWMAKPDGSIFWYNDQWYKYTGTTPEQALGWGWQVSHDPQILPAVTERWQTSLQTGKPFEMEFPLRSANGEFRWFLTRVNPFRGDDGTILLWFGTNTDVSERREQQEALKASEARLRAVVQATPECVKIVAPSGGLMYMNPVGLSMIESDTFTQVQGGSVFDLVAPEFRQQWEDNHRRVCGGERMSWEFQIIGLKGTRRWMETHAVPLPMPDGAVSQLAVTRDITQRKLAEQQRETLLESERAARAEAERVSHMKDEFLATLSHELRTPLNAILGWSQILKSNSSESDLSQGLQTIERNARSQAQIIEDLLDMSRIISGKVRLDVQRIDLHSVIDSAIQTARPAAAAKDIRLQPVLDPLVGQVSGDPSRLQQVFWNLLSNAMKFTPRGGRVQVVLERVNSHVEISIIDTGEGIRPDFLPFVFDRFRQADASTTRRHGGLGLGLAIVKQLVELHGGTVRAKSAGAGQGSTFVVALPLTVVHPDPTPQTERRHPTSAISAPSVEACLSLHGAKILVVDDEPDARGLIERLLVDCHAQVKTASSAAEALTKLQQEKFDVLVSDIGMPGEDGYSLIKQVRKLDSPVAAIPALALTAYARSEDRQRAIISGYHLHVAKPVEPSELITMVSSLAGRMG